MWPHHGATGTLPKGAVVWALGSPGRTANSCDRRFYQRITTAPSPPAPPEWPAAPDAVDAPPPPHPGPIVLTPVDPLPFALDPPSGAPPHGPLPPCPPTTEVVAIANPNSLTLPDVSIHEDGTDPAAPPPPEPPMT